VALLLQHKLILIGFSRLNSIRRRKVLIDMSLLPTTTIRNAWVRVRILFAAPKLKRVLTGQMVPILFRDMGNAGLNGIIETLVPSLASSKICPLFGVNTVVANRLYSRCSLAAMDSRGRRIDLHVGKQQ